RVRIGELAFRNQGETVDVCAGAFAVEGDAKVVTGQERTEGHALRDGGRIFLETDGRRRYVKCPSAFGLKLDVGYPSVRGDRDLGNCIGEVSLLSQRGVLFD